MLLNTNKYGTVLSKRLKTSKLTNKKIPDEELVGLTKPVKPVRSKQNKS